MLENHNKLFSEKDSKLYILIHVSLCFEDHTFLQNLFLLK